MSLIDNPQHAYKSEIFDVLYRISTQKVRTAIWSVIMENRKCTLHEAKNEKIVYKNEVIQILKDFGEIKID